MARSEYYVRPTNGDDTNAGTSHAEAWLTVQHALDTITVDTTDGDRINICDESTLTISSLLDPTTFGNPGRPGLIFQGYTSVSGDGGIFHIDADSNKVIEQSTYDYISFIDGKISNWPSSTLAIRLDAKCNLINMEFDGLGIATKAVWLGTGGFIQGCKFHDFNTGYADTVRVGGCYMFINNFVEVYSENVGLRVSYNSTIIGNMFLMTHANASWGVMTSSANLCLIANNTFLANTPCNGAGVYLSGTTSSGCTIINNYFEGFSDSGYGIYSTATQNMCLLLSNNYYYNNTDNESIAADTVRVINAPVTLSASGVMNNAWVSGDLDLSPAKELINNALVTQFAAGDTVHSKDVGAVQRAKGVIGGPNMQAGRAR